jgi:hypothetical protein
MFNSFCFWSISHLVLMKWHVYVEHLGRLLLPVRWLTWDLPTSLAKSKCMPKKMRALKFLCISLSKAAQTGNATLI